jgi:hypothetical protein
MSAGVKSLLDDLINEATTNTLLGAQTITYRRRNIPAGGSAGYDQSTGVIADPYTNTVITALVGYVRDEDVHAGGADLEASDRAFVVKAADLGAGFELDATAGDMILLGKSAFEVLYVRRQDATGLIVIYARLSGSESQ